MTEPKVVHEWEEDEGQYQIRDTDAGPMLWVVRHSLKSPCQFIKELARLAAELAKAEKEVEDQGSVIVRMQGAEARVQELEKEISDREGTEQSLTRWVDEAEAENKRLRAALETLANNYYLEAALVDIVEKALKEKP